MFSGLTPSSCSRLVAPWTRLSMTLMFQLVPSVRRGWASDVLRDYREWTMRMRKGDPSSFSVDALSPFTVLSVIFDSERWEP
jgi:hypothetical protein